jgi:hypothetical protein
VRSRRRTALSTIESLVAALAAIEPDAAGLPALLAAFDVMVERQLALRAERVAPCAPPRTPPTRPRRTARPAEDLARCVCVYGESRGGAGARAAVAARGRRAGTPPVPLQWVAVRPHTGERFERLVGPAHAAPEDWHLAHLGLTREELAAGVAPAELARDFAAFAGPGAVLLARNQSTLDLALGLRASVGEGAFELARPLKAVAASVLRQRPGTLDACVATLGLTVDPARARRRAAERVARCVAVARCCTALGSAR